MESQPPRQQLPTPLSEAPYQWSYVRISEQVTILVLSNVLSAITLGLGAAMVAVLALLAQWLLHYIVVPTNILTAIAFVGVGIVLLLLVMAIGVGVIIHRNPLLIFSGLVGALVVMTIVQKAGLTDSRKTTSADATMAQQTKGTAQPSAAASGGPDGQR